MRNMDVLVEDENACKADKVLHVSKNRVTGLTRFQTLLEFPRPGAIT